MVTETRWFKSPYVGVVNFSVRKQMSYRASLSMQYVSSVFSTNWWTERVALYSCNKKKTLKRAKISQPRPQSD